MKNKYLIKVSTNEDALENWVWINNEYRNTHIKILNPINKKSIVVFKRTIDSNFIHFYNSKLKTIDIDSNELNLIINEFYRNELDIQENEKIELIIEDAKFLNILLNSNWKHPNPLISSLNKITIVSLFLGCVSIILGIISIIK
jgi:hypothetical protein